MSPFKMLTILGFIQGLMTQLFKLRLKIAKAKAAGVLYKKVFSEISQRRDSGTGVLHVNFVKFSRKPIF